jgi:RNA polymerase sigma-70 factor (ECF subfamily)
MKRMSDESDLVRHSQKGDREAYGRLYKRHADRVMSLVRRVTGDSEAAEDLTAEAFLEGFLRIKTLRDAGAFGSWVYATALNLSKRHLARQAAGERARHRMHGSQEVVSEAGSNPQIVAEQRGLNEWVLRAVNDLPEGLRTPTVLFYYDNLSTTEIAQLLELNVGAVKTRLSRSRRAVHPILCCFWIESVQGSCSCWSVSPKDTRWRSIAAACS